MNAKRFAAILCCIAVVTISYADVVISEFRGKVELRSPGDRWRPVEVGMAIDPDDTISTGFNSTAVLSLGANSVIVSPLTRMTLDAFLEREKVVDTKLFLRVGAVRAQVDDSGTKRQSFSISSPYSTASVRGTDFEFDGLYLRVFRGSVALLIAPPKRIGAAAGQRGAGTGEGGEGDGEEVLVGSGRSVRVDVDFSTGTATASVGEPGDQFSTDPTSRGSGAGGGGSDGAPGAVTPPATRGSVVVTWEWEE